MWMFKTTQWINCLIKAATFIGLRCLCEWMVGRHLIISSPCEASGAEGLCRDSSILHLISGWDAGLGFRGINRLKVKPEPAAPAAPHSSRFWPFCISKKPKWALSESEVWWAWCWSWRGRHVHPAHFSSDHWNRRSCWISSNMLSGSEPGPVLHLLLHHVQLLGESRAGILLSPQGDGYNFLSRARKRRKKKQQKLYLWFREQLVLERGWNQEKENQVLVQLEERRNFIKITERHFCG